MFGFGLKSISLSITAIAAGKSRKADSNVNVFAPTSKLHASSLAMQEFLCLGRTRIELPGSTQRTELAETRISR
eukprot:1276212-Rhodomonas_salina.1